MGTAPQGLLHVVGPTGSGKSTTLACLVDRINKTRKCRIITIEDPVEYSHESVLATVDQRELFADTQSFAAALKFILSRTRRHPRGEMRDFETISAVLTAAETDHLVLATMHGNDAVQAIDRIVDVFQSHQKTSTSTARFIACVVSSVSPRKGGGLAPAFEVMVANPAIRNLIREAKMHQARGTMETSRRDGMRTGHGAARALPRAGGSSHEDVFAIWTIQDRSLVLVVLSQTWADLIDEVAADKLAHDLGGSTANRVEACISVEPLNERLAHIAHASVDLDGFVGNKRTRCHGLVLGHCCVDRDVYTSAVLVSDRRHKRAGRGEASGHLSQPVTIDLKLTDRATKRCPLTGVLNRCIERELRNRDTVGREEQALICKVDHRSDEAAAFPPIR